MVVELGPPSFLSLHINNYADKYLWVALIDREKVFRARKRKEGGKMGMKGQSAPPLGIASSVIQAWSHPSSP